MLVLSRKPGETIQIGDNIWVTVLDMQRGRGIRLGIAAPPDVPILRTELLERGDTPPGERREG
jgi:carbon storage regulator